MRPGSDLVVRAPNHLGDVVVALPAMAAAGADVMVRAWLAPLVEMAALGGRVLPLDDRTPRGWLTAVSTLRRGGYRRGVLLTPSFSAAWLFRWGGIRRLRGTATDGRSWLLTDRIDRDVLGGRHRIGQYKMLMGQDPGGPEENHPLRPPPDAVARWRERLGSDATVVGVMPGSNAPARRWPAERFADLVRRLSDRGVRCVVLGGPGETGLTAAVAAAHPSAVDAGGATDLPGLVALLSVCALVVTNDTGPMHLAGAVGTPTVTLWGPSDREVARPVGVRTVEVDGGPLPCKPCHKNECPRSGAGTVLPGAHEECMRLITVVQVAHAAETVLDGGAP